MLEALPVPEYGLLGEREKFTGALLPYWNIPVNIPLSGEILKENDMLGCAFATALIFALPIFDKAPKNR